MAETLRPESFRKAPRYRRAFSWRCSLIAFFLPVWGKTPVVSEDCGDGDELLDGKTGSKSLKESPAESAVCGLSGIDFVCVFEKAEEQDLRQKL